MSTRFPASFQEVSMWFPTIFQQAFSVLSASSLQPPASRRQGLGARRTKEEGEEEEKGEEGQKRKKKSEEEKQFERTKKKREREKQ